MSLDRTPAVDERVEARLVIGPNASLSERQAWLCMALVSGVALGIAAGFTALGFWPVLPFAGLELAAVGAALWVSLRRNRYREVLSLVGETLRIEIGSLGRGAAGRVELPRAWTRVALERGVHPHEPTRLVLSCSGQRIEIGRCLTDEERTSLAMRIKELLKPVRPEPGERGAARPSAHEMPLGD